MNYPQIIFYIVSATLDILITATLLYTILRLIIRSEKNIQLLIVAVGLFILSLLASIFQMNVTKSILDNIYSWSIAIIVILYRDEIKAYIDDVGSGKFLFSQVSDDEVQYLEGLTNAVFKLSKNKVGSLITIKRTSSLRKFTQNAIELNASFSEYLLISVFQKDSPLHDGAVVIENEKITHASTYFPIAIDINLDKSFGTRHRAAVTISKDTDSISIVTSEETGRVSIAFNGLLYEDINEEFFRQFINEKTIEE